ncbi:uncharacterized protein LOC110995302 isoform X2 [Pieris rapae]|uniref:uncharacterized protein LOC110995302 isoform X2 n=1 Tax=Pieris rapae TaxID=64459 RepID=UPI001E27C29D|nr:uncharacterized protein LOC110995302 isoform X2 [Pieris rapae]
MINDNTSNDKSVKISSKNSLRDCFHEGLYLLFCFSSLRSLYKMDTDASQTSEWLLCYSKRYSGRPYYFNTLTGEASWNLPEHTVELIKARANQSKPMLNTGYPEPNEVFTDNIYSSFNTNAAYNNPTTAKMYNTFSSQSPPIANINFSHCIPQDTYNNVTLGVPLLNVHPNSKNRNNSSNNPKCYLNANHINLQHHQDHTHLFTPVSSKTKEEEFLTLPAENKVTLQKQCNMNDQVNFQDNTHHITSGHVSASLEDDIKKGKKIVEDLHDIWETNGFNISALETLFKIDMRTKIWFLVLDEDVLLKKLNFIKEIRNADNRCRFVVPECVLNRIQKGTTSINKIHMKRALQAAIFISDVLTENCAIVDKENRHDDHIQNIVACCRKYSQKDYKVVLLTECKIDENINEIKCPVFRIEEVEYFMIYGDLKTPHPNVFNPKFMVTIPNNPRMSVSKQTKIGIRDPQIKSHIEKEKHNVTDSKPTHRENSEIEMEICSLNDVKKINGHRRNRSDSLTNINPGTTFDDKRNIDVEKNVMFEVTSELMKGNLVSKSEEWISRFTQILEEALNQVLEKAAFQTSPPPWTMYEACECIKRGFKNDTDIVDAANKFGDIIFDNGALRGKINHNINPSTFMKIYSYGVYLIDALQGVFEDDENLQAAEKLLAKLLLDIETPDFNNSFNEIDAINEHSDEATLERTQNQPTPPRITRSKARNIITSVTERADRSKNKLLQFLPGKDNFLSNFELKNLDKDETNEPENIDKTDCVNTTTDAPPKIIRNFTKISTLENKLNPNRSDDLNDLDFILDGAEVPEYNTYTHIGLMELIKAKLGYVFQFCQDTRQRLLNPEKLDKKDVNCQAKKFAELIRFYHLQLTGIYERRKDVYLNVLNFNEAEYIYYKEFVQHCLDECEILNTALSIILTKTGSTLHEGKGVPDTSNGTRKLASEYDF